MSLGFSLALVPFAVLGFLLLVVIMKSFYMIGETQVGLVTKRIGKRLPKGQPIAFTGEAGYQLELLMAGLRFKLWPIFTVEKHPWVQVPPDEVGVVMAQVGDSIPIGFRSGVYKEIFGQFLDPKIFLENGGQKGIQRPVLPPGAMLPIHPVAFMIITESNIYGVPIDEDLRTKYDTKGGLTREDFNLKEGQCKVKKIAPEEREFTRLAPKKITRRQREEDRRTGSEIEMEEVKYRAMVDMVGIVTTHEGGSLQGGDIACRLGGFEDMRDPALTEPIERIEKLLGSQNHKHQSYQDYQKFLDAGGKIGLQHDPLLRGTYNLNPFLVSVENVPMLVVEQGEVAVIKSYVGLSEKDTSGKEFKFGSIVPPGHRGIWQVPLRTGKYPLNPYCYKHEIVPTQILTLNWAEGVSGAHNLDANLSPIEAVSREGFKFTLDLVVQIHVGNEEAPRVISMVGTMQNLVTDVLQAAVGNHFRDKLQGMPAVKFIEERKTTQEDAQKHIKEKLSEYEVETPAVLIQDVTLPKELVDVLQAREIANQQKATYTMEMEAEDIRKDKEAAKGRADQQAALAISEVGITIADNNKQAKVKTAEGEASFIQQTGAAAGAKIESEGMARAKSYKAQVEALGEGNTALVNVFQAIADGRVKITPEVLVGSGGSVFDALMGVATKTVLHGGGVETLLKGKSDAGAATSAESVEKKDEKGEGNSDTPLAPAPPKD